MGTKRVAPMRGEKATEANGCMLMTRDNAIQHVHIDIEPTPHDGEHVCLHCRRYWLTETDATRERNARRRAMRYREVPA